MSREQEEATLVCWAGRMQEGLGRHQGGRTVVIVYHCGNKKENTQVDVSNVILLENVRADLGPQSRPFTTS